MSSKTARVAALGAGLCALVCFLQPSVYAANAEEVLAPLKRGLADLPREKAPRTAAVQKLLDQANELVAANPGEARFLIWKGAMSAEMASINQNMSSLGFAKDARDSFFAAEKLDPTALDWANYNLLAALYANVPGWPIGFGDDDAALKYYRKAVELNPTGAGARHDYARFLLDQEEYEAAARELEFALSAPLRVNETQPEPGISCRRYACYHYSDETDAAFRARIRAWLDEARKELE